MKKILLLALLLPMFATAQYKFKVKDHIGTVIPLFISGVAEGLMDYLDFHYSKPNYYLNPDYSYLNKYKNHDPVQGERFWGSTTVFVSTTDAWHGLKLVRNTGNMTALVLKGLGSLGRQKQRWYVYILEGVGYYLVNRAGFTLGYKMFKTN
jgi:hypothetical protein